MTNDDTWAATLLQLEGQMVSSAFKSIFADSQLLKSDNGTCLIGLRDSQARDWATGRWQVAVERALSRTLHRPVLASFTILEDNPPVKPAKLPAPHPTPTPSPEPARTGIDWRPLRDKAYTPVGIYGTIFWQAWLDQQSNRSYKLWLALQTDDTRNTFEPGFTNFWTPPLPYRIRQLAAVVGAKTNTTSLTGRLTSCITCLHALEDGEPLTGCCGAHQPARWHTIGDAIADEERICQYWSLGAFEVLQRCGLLAAEVVPNATNAHQMRLQVWRLLPLLTPRQVAELPELLQAEHDQWLAGHSQRVLGLSLDDWYRLDAGNLVPTIDGYQQHRALGRYEWNRIKREGESE